MSGGLESHAAFRQQFREILFDIAHAAVTFEDFKKEVLAFFNDVNKPASDEWWAAVDLVRAGHRGLPLGEHGAKRPEIELGHIRHMVRLLGIEPDCASRHFQELGQQVTANRVEGDEAS